MKAHMMQTTRRCDRTEIPKNTKLSGWSHRPGAISFSITDEVEGEVTKATYAVAVPSAWRVFIGTSNDDMIEVTSVDQTLLSVIERNVVPAWKVEA